MADPQFDSNFTIYPVCGNSPSASTIWFLFSLIAQQNAKIDILTAKVNILEGSQAKTEKNIQGLRDDVRYLESKNDDRERLKDENEALRQRIDWESYDNFSVEDVLNSHDF